MPGAHHGEYLLKGCLHTEKCLKLVSQLLLLYLRVPEPSIAPSFMYP
jgi:hypothetical protein